MSEKGPLGRNLDRIREMRAQKTRIHNKDLAWDMAEVELPYREDGATLKKVGDALVSASWGNYPDIKGNTVVTLDELSERTDGKYSEDTLMDTVSQGLNELAADVQARPSLTYHGLMISVEKEREKTRRIKTTDPQAVPTDLAQQVGYKLRIKAPQVVKRGIQEAEKLQARHQSPRPEDQGIQPVRH